MYHMYIWIHRRMYEFSMGISTVIPYSIRSKFVNDWGIAARCQALIQLRASHIKSHESLVIGICVCLCVCFDHVLALAYVFKRTLYRACIDVKVHAVVCFKFFCSLLLCFCIKPQQCFGLGYILARDLAGSHECYGLMCVRFFRVVSYSTSRGQHLSLAATAVVVIVVAVFPIVFLLVDFFWTKWYEGFFF